MIIGNTENYNNSDDKTLLFPMSYKLINIQ